MLVTYNLGSIYVHISQAMVAELKRQRSTEDLARLARTYEAMDGEPTRHSDFWCVSSFSVHTQLSEPYVP